MDYDSVREPKTLDKNRKSTKKKRCVTSHDAKMVDSEPPVYFSINNIPEPFRSADLRNYFSQFVEGRGFQCFHYRHRPEILREPDREPDPDQDRDPGPTAGSARETRTRCCVVAVHAGDADRFVRMYAGSHWVTSRGSWTRGRCVVRRVKVSPGAGQDLAGLKRPLQTHWGGADIEGLL